MEIIIGKFFILIIISIEISAKSKLPKDWIEPDVWGRDLKLNHNDDIIDSNCNCDCNSLQLAEDEQLNQPALMFYKKLLRLLLDKKNFMKTNSGVYNRIMHFELNENQLTILDKSFDPRDWDAVITEIFQNIKIPSRFIHEENYGEWLITLRPLKDYLISAFSSSEVQFTLFAALGIYATVYFSRKYNFGVIRMFLIGCFLLGFFHTYYGCNKDLEIQQLFNLYKFEKNPCENVNFNEERTIWNFFYTRNPREQCIAYLKETNRIKFPFCRPDDVVISYFTDKIMDQFGYIVAKSTAAFKNCSEKIPFPYNIVALIIFGLLLPVYLTLVYKHVIDPRVWYRPRYDSAAETYMINRNIRRPQSEITSPGPRVQENKTDDGVPESFMLNQNNGITNSEITSRVDENISGIEILEDIQGFVRQVLSSENGVNETGKSLLNPIKCNNDNSIIKEEVKTENEACNFKIFDKIDLK